MACAAISAKRRSFMVGPQCTRFDINYHHRCSSHLCEFLLRETAQQQGFQLTGTMETCVPCATIKGRKAGVPSTGGGASEPGTTYHLDLCGAMVASLCGSMYLLVVLDSFSRFMLVYGLRRKSDALAGVKLDITDLAKYHRGNVEVFRVDMGTEWTGQEFRSFCANAGIRIEYTAPHTPQQNAPVESAIWRVMKGGTVCRRSAVEQFNINYSDIPNVDGRGDRLWMESARYSAGVLQPLREANPGNISPHEALTGNRPDGIILSFMQPGLMRAVRGTKLDDQSVKCYYTGQGYQHGRSTVRVLKASTGNICHTRDIVWISATWAPGVGGGINGTPAALPPDTSASPPALHRPRRGFRFPAALAPRVGGGIHDTPAALPPRTSASPLMLPAPDEGSPGPEPEPPLQPAPPPPPPPHAATPPPLLPAPPFAAQQQTPPPPPWPAPEPATSPPLATSPPPPPAESMEPLSRRAVRELRPGRTGGMDDVRLATRTRSGAKSGGNRGHNVGLMSFAGKDVVGSCGSGRRRQEGCSAVCPRRAGCYRVGEAAGGGAGVLGDRRIGECRSRLRRVLRAGRTSKLPYVSSSNRTSARSCRCATGATSTCLRLLPRRRRRATSTATCSRTP